MVSCKRGVLAVVVALAAGVAQSALINNGDGTVSDTSNGLTWVQDWNINGAADWESQKAWAAGLTLAGSSDWLLPTEAQYDAVLAEAGGNYAGLSAVFSNVQFGIYWTLDPGSPSSANVFDADDSGQNFDLRWLPYFAAAVRSGGAALSVPEPQSLALVLLALGAMQLRRAARPLSPPAAC